MADKKKGPVAPTTEAQPKSMETYGRDVIAESYRAGNGCVGFRADSGAIWRYRGKRGRVLAMLANRPGGVTQHDTLPWHTRLGGTIHALRRDGLQITTEIVGRYRHARYRLATAGSLIIHGENRGAGQ